MNNYEKAFLAMAFVLLLVSIAISLPEVGQQRNETAELLDAGKKIIYGTIRFGLNKTDYSYRFSQNVNGYEEEYLLVKSGLDEYVEVNDQLGLKKVYFIGNQTFLCVEYGGLKECSETTAINDSAIKGYYAYLQSMFFSNEKIWREEELFNNTLFPNGFITIKKVSSEEVDGKECKAVEYTIDYSNMSVSDAARHGISLNMPKRFDWKICYAEDKPLYKHFSYVYNGMDYEVEIRIKEFSGPVEIIAPENLSDGAYDLFNREIEAQQTLSECFEKSRAEREKCVSVTAFRLYKPSLCKLAGSQADLCIIRMMPYLKNESWCAGMADDGYKDDCYIEVAGALKDQSYCDYVKNESKLALCINASTPVTAIQTTVEENMDETDESGVSGG